jgi:hypothetical protein
MSWVKLCPATDTYLVDLFLLREKSITNGFLMNDVLSYSFTRILLSKNILGNSSTVKKTSKWPNIYMYYVGLLFMLPLKEKKLHNVFIYFFLIV